MDQAAYCPGRRPPIIPLAIFASLLVANGSVSLLALRATPSTYAWHPFGWFFIVSAFTSAFVVHWFFEGGSWRVSHWSDDDSALEILRTQAAEEQHERMKKDRGEK